MKIHGTTKGGALSKKDFGVAFGGGNGNGCFFTSDFSEDNWSDLGNQDANGGDDYTATSITSGKLRITSNSGSGENGGAVAIRQMTEGLGSSWNIRFNYTTGGSMTANGNNYLYIGVTSDSSYTSSQGANNQSGDAAFFRWHFDTADVRIMNRTWNGGVMTQTSDAQSPVTWADTTTYYFELTYDNTTFSCKEFTNSNYDTQRGDTTEVDDSGLTGMDYLLVGTEYGQGTGVWTIDINEIKVANDTTDAC